MPLRFYCLLIFFSTSFSLQQASAQFRIANHHELVSIVYDIENSDLDSIAAHLLALDIEAVNGNRPEIHTSLDEVEGNVIIIGDVSSRLIKSHLNIDGLEDEWESYKWVFKTKIADHIDQAMFIVGSDPRGMAFGVFDLSEQLGVSPWYWWVDVPVQKRDELIVKSVDVTSASPAVKYRGIFLNDEGWGLEPWASKTFEPEAGNIGPKTYAKIFELLLRLKANMLWPAMHPNTIPFFQMPGNAEVAKKWEIVVGTSHAEPMLRNNVGEWNHERMGAFNYQNNAASVRAYWEKRVKESKGMDAIYTLGMRGIHDSGMEGVRTMEEKVSALETIISDQREMLRNSFGNKLGKIPQSFTPYKEVLEIYESGMKLPEDIIITWPDDNYGHIRRFANEKEQQRIGRGGVYYHISYLGSPHPYLLFSSASPAKIWREMNRAYLHGMDQLWVVNVGDLKRREWETEFFLDLAWDIHSWNTETTAEFYTTVASRDLSPEYANEISELIWEYKRLAAERKPELMGFNPPQWAGWTPVQDPAFSLINFGDEAQKRLKSYQYVLRHTEQVAKHLSPEVEDAFFQFVYFQIAGATALNEKLLYAYKSREYAKQGRAEANALSDSAFAAHNRLEELVKRYNEDISRGKWTHSVDATPGYEKGSRVFFEPITTRINTNGVRGLGVSVEGQEKTLKPVNGNLPEVVTQGSVLRVSSSEAEIYGELQRTEDANGTFLGWPDEGTGKIITGPEKYDVIPYEVNHETKAVFEFENKVSGGVMSLYLMVNHPDTISSSWWVMVNDRRPVLAEGNGSMLKVGEFVLKSGTNRLIIHPHKSGSKLYGLELMQKSKTFTPEYTESVQLPQFTGIGEEEYFIDVFSRGAEAQEWRVEVSDPWILLSERQGVLEGSSTRIWVNVNADLIPKGQTAEGMITFHSQEYLYQVGVVVKKPDVGGPKGAFLERNGLISIPAHAYSQKQEGAKALWQRVTGLGRSGSAMLMHPLNSEYITDLETVKSKAPMLSYDFFVAEGKSADLIIEAVPAFPSDKNKTLRMAVSVDEGNPQWITFDMDSDWTTKVAENRMTGTLKLTLEAGNHKLHLWGTDPSVNPDKIVIDFGVLK